MEIYQSRHRTVQEIMEDQGIELSIFGAGPNLQYLTGTSINWRRFTDLDNPITSLFVPIDGEPIMLAGPFSRIKADPPCEVRKLDLFEDPRPVIKEIAEKLVSKPNKVAIEPYTDASVVLTVSDLYSGGEIVSQNGLLDKIRAIKAPEEIDRLRRVASLTDTVMEEIVTQLDEGISMKEVTLEIERLGKENGASDISFPPTAGFCKSGKGRTDQVYNYNDEEGLEKGTSIAFDVGFVQEGYCSDWGRSVFFGTPPENIQNAYTALMKAVTETIDAIGNEVQKTNQIFPYIEQVCEREGYAEYLRNRHPNGIVGHQIGVEVHEDPWLHPENNSELVDGMVFCIEPKLWSNGEFYLRVEDMVHIADGGAESLTQYDREQFAI